MKILLCYLLTIAVFAQDSSEVNLSLNSTNRLVQYSNSIENNSANRIASFLEIRSNRLWEKRFGKTFNNNINLSSTIEFKKNIPDFIDSDLFLVIASSVIVFGATAAYFKLESDAAYDKYLMTDDKSYLDKTDRFDLYSGIALGALEINFGYLIYNFLTD